MFSQYSVQRFGEEQHPVVIIDGFVPAPGKLAKLAGAQTFAAGGPYYPGIRAPAPPEHLAPCGPVLEQVLREVFGVRRGVRLTETNFSLVTTPPGELKLIQRLPHFDSCDPDRFALLHYLSGTEFGGTGFYRHRATGFESLSAERLPAYESALKEEVERLGPPPGGYLLGSTAQFEQIGQVEAAPNRAVLYAGRILHSGQILKPEGLSSDPWNGRLTVNTFLESKDEA
ncbi:MAG: DUF6445 family protein [Pseudomonadota bacterium]